MPTDTKLQNLIINDLTEEQYKALTPNENELYLTPDTSGGGGSGNKYYAHYITITTNSSRPTAIFTIYLITKDSNKYTAYNEFEKYLTKSGDINVAGYITDTDGTLYDISRLEINLITKQLVIIYYIYETTFNAVDASVTTKSKQRITTVQFDNIYRISDTVIEL